MDTKLLEAIKNYEAPEAAHKEVSNHPPLALAGPTGAGKGTLATYLTQSGDFAPVVSDTTRPPRPHNDGMEVHGVGYWFLTEQEALQKIANGSYIEVKEVHRRTMYGTSREAYRKVVSSGRTPILEIDVQGIEELMQHFPELEAVFLLPPSFDVWQSRLDGRGSMDFDEKVNRLETAYSEIQRPLTNPRFHPVVNHEVIDTAELITSGKYKNPEYREGALKVARELLARTVSFLESHGRTI